MGSSWERSAVWHACMFFLRIDGSPWEKRENEPSCLSSHSVFSEGTAWYFVLREEFAAPFPSPFLSLSTTPFRALFLAPVTYNLLNWLKKWLYEPFPSSAFSPILSSLFLVPSWSLNYPFDRVHSPLSALRFRPFYGCRLSEDNIIHATQNAILFKYPDNKKSLHCSSPSPYYHCSLHCSSVAHHDVHPQSTFVLQQEKDEEERERWRREEQLEWRYGMERDGWIPIVPS